MVLRVRGEEDDVTQAVIYTRFSPRRHADDCQSCDTQEELCRAHAAKQGWGLRSVHRDEAVSGKAFDRPGLEGALADLHRGDVLLVYDRDRIARSVLFAELTRRQVQGAGARIVAVSGDVAGDSPESVFVRQILDAVAELERKRIASKTKHAMLAHQRNGRRMGRHPPYGYRISEEDPSRLAPDLRERRAVRRIRELAAEGLSPCLIARRLDEELPGLARGKRWYPKAVAKIVGR